MKRFVGILVIALSSVALLGLAGCAPKTESADAAMKGVWGYVASAQHASLDIAQTQAGVAELVVSKVVAPEDGWIVVHDDDNGKPGERVGLAQVRKGENVDVRVPLDGETTPQLIVAVHADRGTPGTFDFDMAKAMRSADRPFFVNGKELARVVSVQ